MIAVVLCAGEASRLYPFSDLMPKSMLPVGGKPVLRHIVERLVKYGFNEIIVCVNKKQEALFRDYFGDGGRFGACITYSVSEKPLGTVGEVLKVKDKLKDDFLLYYGDELTVIKLDKLTEAHKLTKRVLSVATLALIASVRSEVGMATGFGGRYYVSETYPEAPFFDQITTFEEKPTMRNVWAGIAMFSPEALNYAREGDDFARDLIPRLIAEHTPVYAYVSDVEWFDVGTISHYRRVCKLAEAEGTLASGGKETLVIEGILKKRLRKATAGLADEIERGAVVSDLEEILEDMNEEFPTEEMWLRKEPWASASYLQEMVNRERSKWALKWLGRNLEA